MAKNEKCGGTVDSFEACYERCISSHPGSPCSDERAPYEACLSTLTCPAFGAANDPYSDSKSCVDERKALRACEDRNEGYK
jgi:hypothetical protein